MWRYRSIKISSNSDDPPILKVVYNLIHAGHTPGTSKTWLLLPSVVMLAWLWSYWWKAMMNWVTIKHLLRQDTASLTKLLDLGYQANIDSCGWPPNLCNMQWPIVWRKWADLTTICQQVSVDGTPRLLLLVDTASQKLEHYGRRNVPVCILLGLAVKRKY
jgi:hypothetical protein